MKIFFWLIFALYCVTTVLIYQAGGDMLVWALLGTPMVILRVLRAWLLVK